ncbi:MAG: GntR family transcriptional regulator [Lachnospiraceae bacterium]
MFQIDKMSCIPVYEQLIKEVENYILTGILKSNDKMPSVRLLSTELVVNPNTIQKAYAILETRGITYTVPGKGSFVAEDAVLKISEASRQNLLELETALKDMKLAGVSREEVLELVNSIFNN